jgi:hypothetical protein
LSWLYKWLIAFSFSMVVLDFCLICVCALEFGERVAQ